LGAFFIFIFLIYKEYLEKPKYLFLLVLNLRYGYFNDDNHIKNAFHQTIIIATRLLATIYLLQLNISLVEKGGCVFTQYLINLSFSCLLTVSFIKK
jgi:hypothetical protein